MRRYASRVDGIGPGKAADSGTGSTTSGRVAHAVFSSLLVAAFIAGWVVMIRRPARLQITEDTISYVPRNGRVSSLSRQWGDELRFVQRLRGRIWTLGLTIVG